MKIIKTVNRILVTIVLVLTSGSIMAEEEFSEGRSYEILAEAQPVQTGEKIEVVVLFWYRCPHCYSLEPHINNWKKTMPGNVEFISIPAILSARWELHARIFYTLEVLGLTEKLHGPLFDVIHDQRRPINSLDQFAAWAAENKADEQLIRDTFDSFAVETKINFSRVMTKRYGSDGVPDIIVDGKFRTSLSMAGSHDELFKIMNFLIEKAQSERSES